MVTINDPVKGPAEVRISADEAGQRIDNFLLRILKGVPRSRIYRMLRTGEVRVSRRRIKPDYRLQPDDLVRIPPVRRGENHQPVVPGGAGRHLESRILYEDKRLIVVNKPSGMAVHGGSGLSYGVIEALRAARPQEPFLELVHRLDRETSGCLLVAKRRSTLRQLHQALREGSVSKRYLALVKGRWEESERWVDAPLERNVLRSGERMVRVDPAGKASRTLFVPQRAFADATLTAAFPVTGRTHQIRVHAQYLGRPIAGDDKYGDGPFNQWSREKGLRRLFLHASDLEFPLPETGEPFKVHAPLDDDLSGFIDALA